MLKVLEVFGEPISNGGQESFVVNVLSHMNYNNLNIDLLTPYYCENDYYKKIIQDLGGKIWSFGVDFKPGRSRQNIVAPLKEFLENHPYDIVHVHSGSISVLTLVAKTVKHTGVRRVIVHSHCGIEKPTLKNFVLRHIAALSMQRNADIFCACSYEAAIAKYPDKTAKKSLIIKNGVDTDLFTFNEETRINIRNQLDISQDAVVLGHVGRFNYQKNHTMLIDIFSKYKKVNDNSYLILIGAGELEKEIKEKVLRLGLGDSVHFVGNTNVVHEYLQAFDLFVLPSHFEGLPIVGVEAQAAGLKVIVSSNVSKELALTSLVSFVDLDRVETWVNAIIASLPYERNSKWAKEQLQMQGFDINTTAQTVRSLYFNEG